MLTRGFASVACAAAAGLALALACNGPNPAFRIDPPHNDAGLGGAGGTGNRITPEVSTPDLPEPIETSVVVEPSRNDDAALPPDARGGGGGGDVSDALPSSDAGAKDADASDRDARPPIVLPTPVAHWRLDESNGTVATDERTLNPGMLSKGASFRPGGGFPMPKFPNAGSVSLDGRDGYVELGVRSMPSMGNPMTAAAWFWLSSMSTGRKNVIAIINSTAGRAIQIGLENGKMSAWGWDSAAIVASATSAAPGWHHIAYSYDGSLHRLYEDGKLIDASPTTMVVTPIKNIRLGAYDPSEGEKLTGMIDDVRIYDVPLDAAQIALLQAGQQ